MTYAIEAGYNHIVAIKVAALLLSDRNKPTGE
jgi:hypothetical protein